MNNFITRVISAVIYAAIFIFSILFSQETYIGLITAFGCVCLWEFSRIIKLKGSVFFMIILIGLVVANYLYPIIPSLFLLLLLSVFHCSFLIIDLYAKKFSTEHILVKILHTKNYIILPFFFLAYLPFIDGTYNPLFIIFSILIIWANDSFAYLVGKNFGKTKLFERISPKKTIEGFIGGFIFSVITGLIISKFSDLFSTLNWVIIAALISIIGTYGDLIESKFKRKANVKDSGTIMPGHGGLLDRLDSLFFLSPFLYLYIHYIV